MSLRPSLSKSASKGAQLQSVLETPESCACSLKAKLESAETLRFN